MNKTQKLLKISPDKLKAFNSVLLDPNSQVMKDFLAVVAKYGTPEEINRKLRAARKMDNLCKIVEERNPDALKDLKWLIEQRDRGAFISVAGLGIDLFVFFLVNGNDFAPMIENHETRAGRTLVNRGDVFRHIAPSGHFFQVYNKNPQEFRDVRQLIK